MDVAGRLDGKISEVYEPGLLRVGATLALSRQLIKSVSHSGCGSARIRV